PIFGRNSAQIGLRSYSAWFEDQIEQRWLELIGKTHAELTPDEVAAFDRFWTACDLCSQIKANGALPGRRVGMPSFFMKHQEGEERAEAWERLVGYFPKLAQLCPNEDKPGEVVGLGWKDGIFNVLGDRLRSLLSRIQYIGPLRELPERAYSQRDLSEKHGSAGNQYAVWMLHKQPDLIEPLNWWLKQFSIPYEVSIESRNDRFLGTSVRLSLRDTRSDANITLKDVGFGISQMLPIFVKGLTSGGGILCCEQPELHLHPRLQAQMADFFIATAGVHVSDAESTAHSNFPALESASWAKRGLASGKVQWIVETHSELLILRIQRRIREGILNPQDVCVLYVDHVDGGARVSRLRLDERGEFIDEWPDGFFDDGYLEVYPPRRS
ncbi:MAG: AAA family ATPase, partial [Planctomycetaceae bacterium]